MADTNLTQVNITFNASANDDLFDDIKTKLIELFPGYTQATFTNGFRVDMSLLFDADYTGDITVNGKASKARAKVAFNFNNILQSCILSAAATGEITLRF